MNDLGLALLLFVGLGLVGVIIGLFIMLFINLGIMIHDLFK